MAISNMMFLNQKKKKKIKAALFVLCKVLGNVSTN